MNNYTKYALTFFALTIIGLGVPMTAATSSGILYQHSAGMVSLETDDISIKVTGNNQAPHFHWWSPDSSIDYHVMFVKMFEANDTIIDGVYETSVDTIVGDPFILPTTGWNFSGFNTVEENGNTTEVHFDFATTDSDIMIEVHVHMYLDRPDQVKFDVVVDNWEWTYDDSLLVLMFTVTESVHGEPNSDLTPSGLQKVGTKFQFGDAYFGYNETAIAANNSLEVNASFGDGNAIFLAIENFGNDTLVYDPILGVTQPEAVTPIDPIIIGLAGSIAIIVVLAIVLIKRR